MENKKVVIIRGSSLDRETRATKIIKSLTENNYDVHLLWWDRGIECQRSERGEAGDHFKETPFHFRAPYGSLSILYLPFWWIFIFINLMRKNWDIVHVIQVISLPPAIVAGKLKGKRIIYDMLDTYEDSLFLPKPIRNFCVSIDKMLMRSVDAVVLADEEQIQEVNGIPNDNVVIIYDSPLTRTPIIKERKDNSLFTLFFAGALQKNKYLNLDKMFAAVEQLDGVKVVIAGYGDLVPYIQEVEQKMPGKIEYIGEITHAEVLQRSADADLLFMLRDPILPVNKYICGSKILESMMCGTAIIVNKGSSTANKVQNTNCGFIVNANDVYDIMKRIEKLKSDSDLCVKLGNNGRNAYDNEYSWDIMRERLKKLYDLM